MNAANPTPSQSPDSSRRRGSWIVWLWFWMTLGLIAIVQIPKEITAWKYAAALEAREAGDKSRGYELLDAAIQQNMDKAWYQDVRYRWLKEDERFAEALEILEATPGTSLSYRREKSQLLLHLRRFPEAVKICEGIRDESQATGVPSLSQARNELAYARALGKIDLAAAAADMDAAVTTTTAELKEALEKLESQQYNPWAVVDATREAAVAEALLPAALDTRGFVQYQMDDPQAAEADLNEAVKRVEPDIIKLLQSKTRLAKMSRSLRDVEQQLAAPRQMLAVLIYHRGLNRQKLGREAEAKQDFARVRELIGKEPDETLF